MEPSETPKYVAGCGGCGCLTSLLSCLASGVCMALAADPKTREAAPFVPVFWLLTGAAFLVGAPLLGWGVYSLKKQQQSLGD